MENSNTGIMMRRAIDIRSWERRDHFNFFSAFREPFFGLTARIDCTEAYKFAKTTQNSFFLLYLHKSLVAANGIPNFSYRIEGEKVYEYDTVDASPTINRPDGTFGFSYLKYKEDFEEFRDLALPVIERVRKSSGLKPAISGENVIHYSSIPWVDFTALSHARHFDFADSCPKISFGKMTESEGRRSMPVSVHVHHALVDGIHVGQFLEKFQGLMDTIDE